MRLVMTKTPQNPSSQVWLPKQVQFGIMMIANLTSARLIPTPFDTSHIQHFAVISMAVSCRNTPPPLCTSVISPLKPMLELLNIINATTTNLSPLPTCRTLDFNACVREIKWFWTYSNIYMAFDINECCCCCYQNWMFNRYEEPTHVSQVLISLLRMDIKPDTCYERLDCVLNMYEPFQAQNVVPL